MTKARVATRYGKDASYLRLPAGIPTGAGTMAGRILNARPDRVLVDMPGTTPRRSTSAST